ncbi:Diacetyl reductase [(S)-acetoin forming] [Seminavis robusta]|uniref:Diacetyl reductase [(S)-acetoin forming] n=1 Tax=Seminavis robusta TaxID=568900 RepID=A0A9N8DRV4_9STRA|nr:Diacetyl reductase [(S)-acetoin forming] [Seminavis robusta]|eukprot:Sro311_g114180.1 Diacetyl reductase [(S)-acetoin forming] (359) ;mRNA; f:8670-9746
MVPAATNPNLSNAVCVITGSNSGFGMHVAKGIARQGGAVVISGRNAGKNERVKAECEALGGKAIAVTTDISDNESVKNLFTKAREAFGDITHVFLNAGVFPTSCPNYALDDDEVAIKEIENQININVKGTLFTVRKAFKTLTEQGKGGCVVFTSSVGASMGNGCGEILPAGNTIFSLYTSTKTFVDSVARGSTTFLKDHNIRTYTISPSVYITGLYGNQAADGTGSVVNPLLKDYSGDARDVAKVVLALMDGSSSWKPGSNVACEGPFTYDVHERYKIMYAPESFGIASPPIPMESLCNYLGEPASVTKEDLEEIYADYKAAQLEQEAKKGAAFKAAKEVEPEIPNVSVDGDIKEVVC